MHTGLIENDGVELVAEVKQGEQDRNFGDGVVSATWNKT